MFSFFAAMIALDWLAFGGQYELLFLREAGEVAANATNSVEDFFARNLRRG